MNFPSEGGRFCWSCVPLRGWFSRSVTSGILAVLHRLSMPLSRGWTLWGFLFAEEASNHSHPLFNRGGCSIMTVLLGAKSLNTHDGGSRWPPWPEAESE